MLEVFATFLRLGCTSFGGPIAHIGYIRRECVERRAWVPEAQFAQILALCQFLPGPASSQLVFSLGLVRAGGVGALLANLAFTLPSALLLLAFAGVYSSLAGPTGQALIHGLKLVAVAVVADGVVRMARQLCPDAPRIAIAALATLAALAIAGTWIQLGIVALGAAAGLVVVRAAQPLKGSSLAVPHGAVGGALLLAVFALLLAGLPLLAHQWGGLAAVAEAFYRAGALVFGGGHVVLPLLRDTVVAPGWVPEDEFLAGYGAAQAIPGPLFSVAAYLGARLPGAEGGVLGAALALVFIFAPGLLLVAGALPLWGALVGRPGAARAVAGINAAVVGLLAAALYDPLWTSAVHGIADAAIAAAGFVLLALLRAPPLAAVAWCVGAAFVFA
jgi:chromate transporter